MQFPGAMPEEIALARRRRIVRRAPLRVDGSFAAACAVSGLLILTPALIGWGVGRIGGITGVALAVLAGSVVSVLATLLAARAWLRLAPSDRLFADATIAGWLRRARAERSVAQAREIFADPGVAPIELHVDKLISIARSLEARDARTNRHSSRVALRAVSAGKQLGLSGDDLTRLRAAAKLHDIGALREPVWAEPDEEERLALALAGADLVAFTGDRRLIAALQHQREHFDGSGAPDGLSGDAIPLAARIIAVADAYDTVSREHGQPAALAELKAGSGSLFDPAVVDAFLVSAQAGPVSAVRGAAAGVFPKAAQGAADLLRGSAGVVAAASIATTAVVASTAPAPLPQHHHSSSAAHGPAVAAVTGSSHVAAQSTDANAHGGGRVRGPHPATTRGDESAPGQSHKPAAEDHEIGGNSTGSDATPAPSPASSSQSSGSGTQKPAPASNPVQDVTDNVNNTVDNTTQTVDQTVQDVTQTVNDTVDTTTKTVGGVVGGLTGKK